MTFEFQVLTALASFVRLSAVVAFQENEMESRAGLILWVYCIGGNATRTGEKRIELLFRYQGVARRARLYFQVFVLHWATQVLKLLGFLICKSWWSSGIRIWIGCSLLPSRWSQSCLSSTMTPRHSSLLPLLARNTVSYICGWQVPSTFLLHLEGWRFSAAALCARKWRRKSHS